MKISSNVNNSFEKIDGKNKLESKLSKEPSHAKASSSQNAGATVSVSVRAKDAQKIKDVAMSVPDIDEAKVAKFQQLIDSGEYDVDAEAVAERMIAEHMVSE